MRWSWPSPAMSPPANARPSRRWFRARPGLDLRGARADRVAPTRLPMTPARGSCFRILPTRARSARRRSASAAGAEPGRRRYPGAAGRSTGPGRSGRSPQRFLTFRISYRIRPEAQFLVNRSCKPSLLGDERVEWVFEAALRAWCTFITTHITISRFRPKAKMPRLSLYSSHWLMRDTSPRWFMSRENLNPITGAAQKRLADPPRTVYPQPEDEQLPVPSFCVCLPSGGRRHLHANALGPGLGPPSHAPHRRP